MHLQSVEAETKPCCDKSPPQDLDHLIGVKMSVLASQQSEKNDLVMEDVAVLIKQLKEAQAELKELQQWKQSMESLEGRFHLNYFIFNYNFQFFLRKNTGTTLH